MCEITADTWMWVQFQELKHKLVNTLVSTILEDTRWFMIYNNVSKQGFECMLMKHGGDYCLCIKTVKTLWVKLHFIQFGTSNNSSCTLDL